jgi:hypothetical protein
MKRISIYLGMVCVLALGSGLTGCYKDVVSPETDPDGPAKSVSFKEELAPMLEKKCATAGCHVSGAHKPYLSKDLSYSALANGGYVNTIVPKSSLLYQKVYGDMSEYIPAPADKAMVYDWIRNGAPNN